MILQVGKILEIPEILRAEVDILYLLVVMPVLFYCFWWKPDQDLRQHTQTETETSKTHKQPTRRAPY